MLHVEHMLMYEVNMKENKIVKLQRRSSDIVVSIPVEAHKELKDIDYLQCHIDEDGIHYKKLETD